MPEGPLWDASGGEARGPIYLPEQRCGQALTGPKSVRTPNAGVGRRLHVGDHAEPLIVELLKAGTIWAEKGPVLFKAFQRLAELLLAISAFDIDHAGHRFRTRQRISVENSLLFANDMDMTGSARCFGQTLSVSSTTLLFFDIFENSPIEARQAPEQPHSEKICAIH